MAKWLVIIATIYIYGMFMGATFEKHNVPATWEGSSTTQVTTISYLMNASNAVQKIPVLGNIPLPLPNGDYFKTLYKVITLQFSFITGAGYTMFYWTFFLPIAMFGLLSMLVLFIGTIRGNITRGI